MSSAAVFAVVAVTFYAGHQVADHVVQTDRQAANKATPGLSGWRHIAGHVLSYHVLQAAMLIAVTALFHLPVTVVGASVGIGVSALTHGILDRRWPVRWILNHTGSPEFANRTTPIHGMYLADQALHYGCLWLAALLTTCLSGGSV